jgi:transcriptional regulator with XRE-family HTH domain
MRHSRIRLLILERFWSQGDFALAVGASESQISRVILGRRRLSEQEAKRWSEVLKCSLKVLEPAIDNKTQK